MILVIATVLSALTKMKMPDKMKRFWLRVGGVLYPPISMTFSALVPVNAEMT